MEYFSLKINEKAFFKFYGLVWISFARLLLLLVLLLLKRIKVIHKTKTQEQSHPFVRLKSEGTTIDIDERGSDLSFRAREVTRSKPLTSTLNTNKLSLNSRACFPNTPKLNKFHNYRFSYLWPHQFMDAIIPSSMTNLVVI